MLAKKPRKIAIKPLPKCAIPHENQSQSQISCELLQDEDRSLATKLYTNARKHNRSPFDFNLFKATLRMSFTKPDVSVLGYIMSRRVLALNISVKGQASIIFLVSLQGSLIHVCLKYLSNTFDTESKLFCSPFNAQCPKMVRHTLKILQHLLQHF